MFHILYLIAIYYYIIVLNFGQEYMLQDHTTDTNNTHQISKIKFTFCILHDIYLKFKHLRNGNKLFTIHCQECKYMLDQTQGGGNAFC